MFWLLTAVAGLPVSPWNYAIPITGLLVLLLVILQWGITLPVFALLALTLDGGLLCTLFLPGSHEGHFIIFFSAVPLCYVLGGAKWGRLGSASFLVLTLVLLILRAEFGLEIDNLKTTNESLIAAVACLVLQFVIAEANGREHEHRLAATIAHQFTEPNSQLPNRNALQLQTLDRGQALVLVKFGNLAFEEASAPGGLGQSLRAVAAPYAGLYWIADREYVFLDTSGRPRAEVEGQLLRRLVSGGLPGLHARTSVQICCVPAEQPSESASRLLVEAELQQLVRFGSGLGNLPIPSRIRDLVRSLRSVFAEQRMEAFFQPVYDGENEGIAFLEALTRLELDGQLVSPEKYLGLLETLGLDRQLTEFILNEAVRFSLESGYSVSVNLTYRDLEDLSFLPRLLEACSQLGNRGQKLILELTEHIAFSDPAVLTGFIQQVHEAGGLVFLDDFGMGYSNYGSIAAARFDAIKVAGSLVSRAPESEEIRVLVAGVARFAQASGIAVVAEHISTPTIFTLARDEGIRYLQGFLLHEPVRGSVGFSGSPGHSPRFSPKSVPFQPVAPTCLPDDAKHRLVPSATRG